MANKDMKPAKPDTQFSDFLRRLSNKDKRALVEEAAAQLGIKLAAKKKSGE